MSICSKCLRDVCTPCVYARRAFKPPFVTVASDDQLCRTSHVQRLAIATHALNLPRRELPNWMADQIFGYRGNIRWPGGRGFIVGEDDIDAAFNDDGSFRWLSDFVQFAERDPQQKPQFRMIGRLRLIDLSFRIYCPERAALIAR